ncbi:hypothetical protein PR202_ga04160 [Eleusine coracana subsp. coracana]|uniref:Uncharacterized protein n=1 Tax=Eleusine coracana subsp. coracana TaxID=191504 RepID=A0AAV5BR95_ELECO|nr:hypothetical protein PR202_ga04160 [Eleusine coracana subsp. coracana]
MRLEAELAYGHVPLSRSGQDKVVLEDLSKLQDVCIEIPIKSPKIGDDDMHLSQVVQEPLEDGQIPLLIRSEVDQLIGHQLIKALSGRDKVVMEDLSKLQDVCVEILVKSPKIGDDNIHLPQVAQEPLEDGQTPLLIRSEADQLIGHKLIKVLSNFKQNVVAPLSSSNLRRNHNLKNKINCRKPTVKVV